MMKHHTTLATGLAAILVVPALTRGQDELEALHNALAGTVRALEVLGGLEERAAAEPDRVAGWIRSATETPHLQGPALDDRMTVLRREVSLLQMELDTLEDPGAGEIGTTASALPDLTQSSLPSISSGLDASMRDLLGRGMRTLGPETAADTASGTRRGTGAAGGDTSERLAPRPEEDGYSADVLGQARANYHAGRYEVALVLLERQEDLLSLYWRSRCLTRLERYDGAIEVLTRIIAAEGDSYEGRRAATDLEFVQWKQDFTKNLPEGLRKPVSDR